MSSVNEVLILWTGTPPGKPCGKDETDTFTCSVIKGKNGFNVIVDPVNLSKPDAIEPLLQKINLIPSDITAIIITHVHGKHDYVKDSLFEKAKYKIIGNTITQDSESISHDFQKPYNLTDNIFVMSTPGHTENSVSIIVHDTNFGNKHGKIAICGSLFQNEHDINDSSLWKKAKSENVEAHRTNRKKVAEMVNFIIPGRGHIFEVTEAILETLNNQELLSLRISKKKKI